MATLTKSAKSLHQTPDEKQRLSKYKKEIYMQGLDSAVNILQHPFKQSQSHQILPGVNKFKEKAKQKERMESIFQAISNELEMKANLQKSKRVSSL